MTINCQNVFVFVYSVFFIEELTRLGSDITVQKYSSINRQLILLVQKKLIRRKKHSKQKPVYFSFVSRSCFVFGCPRTSCVPISRKHFVWHCCFIIRNEPIRTLWEQPFFLGQYNARSIVCSLV